MRKHMPTRILAGGDAHLVMGASDHTHPIRFRVTINGAPPGADHGFDVDADGGRFPTSGFTNWCGRQGRSASTRLKSSFSAQASAPMVLGSDRYRPVSAADAAGALASGRVRGVNAARDGWDHGSQRGQDEINRCFMAAPGANGLALCNCVYGSRLGRSVLQISCGIMFVEWFIGTGPGILATARSDCGLACGCGANQAPANLCGVRGPLTGWQRCA